MTAVDRPAAAPAPGANGTSSRARELADLLRSRRGRLRPAEVGLPAGARRRTQGLRREEVAQLAAISTTYYTFLEQGRDVHPSRQVLDALARALRLESRRTRPPARTRPRPPGAYRARDGRGAGALRGCAR